MLSFGLRGERFGEDGVQIIVVNDHDVFDAAAGGYWETTGLVAVYLAGDGNGLHVDKVRSLVGGSLVGRSSYFWSLAGCCFGFFRVREGK
jgi:hypothetical protein